MANSRILEQRRKPSLREQKEREIKKTVQFIRAMDVVGDVPGQRTVEVTLKLPPPPQKLGLILQDDLRTPNHLPVLTAIRPTSTFHNEIHPHLINNYWITSIKDEEFGETQISDSNMLVEELTKRRKNGEERTVELQFTLRGQRKSPPEKSR